MSADVFLFYSQQVKDFVIGQQQRQGFTMASKMPTSLDAATMMGNSMDLYAPGSSLNPIYSASNNSTSATPTFIYPPLKGLPPIATDNGSSFPFPPRATYVKSLSDPLTVAVSQPLEMPNGMLELLNAPYDSYVKQPNKMINPTPTLYHPNPMLGAPLAPIYTSPPLDSSSIKPKQEATNPGLLKCPPPPYGSGDNTQQMLNSNTVSSSSNRGEVMPSVSRSSSPFTDYTDPYLDPVVCDTGTVGSSTPTIRTSQHDIPDPKNGGALTSNSGSSLLMGNQWTSYRAAGNFLLLYM